MAIAIGDIDKRDEVLLSRGNVNAPIPLRGYGGWAAVNRGGVVQSNQTRGGVHARDRQKLTVVRGRAAVTTRLVHLKPALDITRTARLPAGIRAFDE
jgi:hypothetical protein